MTSSFLSCLYICDGCQNVRRKMYGQKKKKKITRETERGGEARERGDGDRHTDRQRGGEGQAREREAKAGKGERQR